MAFTRAAKTNEITPGTVREFQVEGKAIALANSMPSTIPASIVAGRWAKVLWTETY